MLAPTEIANALTIVMFAIGFVGLFYFVRAMRKLDVLADDVEFELVRLKKELRQEGN